VLHGGAVVLVSLAAAFARSAGVHEVPHTHCFAGLEAVDATADVGDDADDLVPTLML
jgi:hypothetical protein